MTADVNGTSRREGSHSRVLVTGGSGFIGRRVVRALMDEGADVTVADKRAFPDAGSYGDVPGGEVRTIIGDLCDPSVVAQAVRPGTDVIIHLAAVTRVPPSILAPPVPSRVNPNPTPRLPD